MSVPDKEARILFQKSGNHCAFPACGKALTYVDQSSGRETEISLSDIAHIVAEAEDGPRGQHHLPLDQRNTASNLILLCKECHRKVDALEPTYPVERLRAFKEDHEKRIDEATSAATRPAAESEPHYQTEQLYSTLLPVLRLPKYVYSATTVLKTEDDVKRAIPRPNEPNLMYPFILRGDQLSCFNEPGNSDNPFLAAAKDGRWQRHDSGEWWCHEDRLLWFQDLLGRSLNKLTGRRGLMLDKDHRRYYFPPNESPGENVLPRKVRYKPLNRKASERSVVWQPVRRKTGEKRPYWYHLAASLVFRRVAADSWALCVRPEYRITTDGFTPYEADAVGSVVTRKRAHAFNNDLLEDLQFWRSYLSDGKPTIVLWFGGAQQIFISSSMLEGAVCWPGMPQQYKLQFQNIDFDEDLFSLAERQALDEEYDDELTEEGEDEDAH